MFDYFTDRSWMYKVGKVVKGLVEEHFCNCVHEFIRLATSNNQNNS